jgi:hypothetical protein
MGRTGGSRENLLFSVAQLRLAARWGKVAEIVQFSVAHISFGGFLAQFSAVVNGQPKIGYNFLWTI